MAFDLAWIGARAGGGERRQVVVVAVGFPAVTGADPEIIADLLDRRRSFVARIAGRYGGLVERADPDLQLLCWGWPAAHEADGRLAVAAALEIAAEHQHKARCGVDAGIAITPPSSVSGAGGAGGPIGEVMGTAVRQKALAEAGQVVVSEAVSLLVAGVFRLQSFDCAEMGVRLWSIQREPQETAVTVAGGGDLIGRDSEIAALEESWSEVQRGGCRLVLIEGEPGVGKTVLANRAARLAVETGGGVAMVSCLPERQGRPRAAVLALEQLLGQPLADAAAKSKASRPLAIVLDDLQWADAQSAAELQDLCSSLEERSGLLVVLSSRPGCQASDTLRDSADTHLGLRLLTKPEIAAIVAKTEFAGRLSPQSRRLICEHSDGVVSYAIELARLCATLPDENAHHRLLAGPNRINAALTRQLDGLAGLKPLAQTAAVLGRAFDARVLSAVLEMDERVVEERLGLLVRLGVLSGRENGKEHLFCFKHALLWSQAYGSVLKTRRRDLHLTMARELELRYAGDADVRPEVVAYHWKKAGKPHEAFSWWSLAAQAAAVRGADANSIQFIREALAANRQTNEPCSALEEAELLELLARQQQALRGSASGEAISAYAQALELLEDQPANTSDLDLDIAWGLASIHLVRGEINAALTSSSTLFDTARERGRDDMQVIALRIHGTANLMGGRVGAAVELLSKAVERLAVGVEWHSPRNLISDPAASALAHLASAQGMAGDAAGARASRLSALARAAAIKDAHTSSNILGVLALGAVHLGEVGIAAALARASQSVAQQHGHSYWERRAALILAWAAARPQPVQRLPAMLEALEAYRGNGTGRASVIAHCLAAEVAIGARQPQQALSLLKPFRNKGHLQGEWIYIPELLRIEALALSVLGADSGEVDKRLCEAHAMALGQGATAILRRVAETRSEIGGAKVRRHT